jgi:hypothetical protein
LRCEALVGQSFNSISERKISRLSKESALQLIGYEIVYSGILQGKESDNSEAWMALRRAAALDLPERRLAAGSQRDHSGRSAAARLDDGRTSAPDLPKRVSIVLKERIRSVEQLSRETCLVCLHNHNRLRIRVGIFRGVVILIA